MYLHFSVKKLRHHRLNKHGANWKMSNTVLKNITKTIITDSQLPSITVTKTKQPCLLMKRNGIPFVFTRVLENIRTDLYNL